MHEGMKFVFDFIKQPPKSVEEKIRTGQQIVQLLNQRESELRHAYGMTTYARGGLIYVLKQDDLWQQFPGVEESWKFSDFCTNVLKTSLQTANAHLRIWERSQFIQLEPEEIDKIGWNAAQNLIRVAQNRDDVEHWLEVYDQCDTQEQFIEQVREEINKRDGKIKEKEPELAEERFVRFSSSQDAKFYDQCISIAVEALEKEKKRSVTNVEATLFIMGEWRAHRDPKFFEKK